MKTALKKIIIATSIAGSLSMVAGTAGASHFRGGALIPSVDANGLLTIQETTFWRKTFVAQLGNVSVTGVGTATATPTVVDQSDSRYAVVTRTHSIQLTSAGTYDIGGGSCCRVSSSGLGNWAGSSFDLDSRIVWDGTTATTPINFTFSTIQPEVSRLAGSDYSQGLNATSPDGLTLTYNQDLNVNINSQVPGFTVDPTTGLMTIVGDVNRAQITDHTAAQNPGADAAFSGNIIASNGSFVEFDWMFDGVDAASNQAPVVADAIINALVGPGPISHIFTALDAEDGALLAGASWDPNLVLGAGFIHALPTFNTATQTFSWDTTGYAPGTYLIQARAFDSQNVGDFGLLTVNLSNPTNPPTGIPLPGSIFLFGLGLAALGWKRKH
ncbi:PEP-CTERM sorting domain-containing protein [Neptunomonas japonica]|uniref:Ice-binding protein C-terminal domain-containing protein n=1 Tax=Neptunomonas japonica JAMM 1380 TaxID=1441457 RepID=A0A7R6SUM7_9GAMM|nr:PEP-CTERM sorting domain-containing protein [Neptunomonas japonica]BBB28516.1 conserved hypothetical protein [Neptunomonas japonica JAMM 1380]